MERKAEFLSSLDEADAAHRLLLVDAVSGFSASGWGHKPLALVIPDGFEIYARVPGQSANREPVHVPT